MNSRFLACRIVKAVRRKLGTEHVRIRVFVFVFRWFEGGHVLAGTAAMTCCGHYLPGSRNFKPRTAITCGKMIPSFSELEMLVLYCETMTKGSPGDGLAHS